MSAKTFVRCRVSAGFFKSEYYVVLNPQSAFVVDRDAVRVNDVPENNEVDGKVQVYVIEESPQNQVLIELSGEPVIGGLRTWVAKDQLEHVAAA
jgi:hypothetical protein